VVEDIEKVAYGINQAVAFDLEPLTALRCGMWQHQQLRWPPVQQRSKWSRYLVTRQAISAR